DIQRIVLGQVTAGSVRLGAIDVRGLIDALQAGHAVFLVKLGTLRQVRYAIKIFDFEKIAAPSVPPETIFDVTISVNRRRLSTSRKEARIAACMRKMSP